MTDPDTLSAAVNDLTARVEQLEHAAGTADQQGPDPRLRQIESVLARLGGEIAELRAQHAAEQKQRELRLPWDELTREQAKSRWTELRSWVDQLVIRNGIGPKEIPNCWYLHDGLVDELEALRWASLAAYRAVAPGTEPLRWREALHRARARWAVFNPNGCAVEHSQTRTRRMSSDNQWQAFLTETLCTYPPEPPDRTG